MDVKLINPFINATLNVLQTMAFVKCQAGKPYLKKDPDYNYKGGIKLITIDPEDKWALLDYAYETWKEKQEANDIKEAPST